MPKKSIISMTTKPKFILAMLIRIHFWNLASEPTMTSWRWLTVYIQCLLVSITRTFCLFGFILYPDSAYYGNWYRFTWDLKVHLYSTHRPTKLFHLLPSQWFHYGFLQKLLTICSTQSVTHLKARWISGLKLQIWLSFSFSAYFWSTAYLTTWTQNNTSLATWQFL